MLNNKIMKKIYIYTSLLLLTVTGCKKQLLQNPSNAVAARVAFTKPSDFTNALLGAYGALRGGSYYGGSDGGGMNSTPDIMSDNLIISSLGRHSQSTFFLFSYGPTTTWGLWG